MRRRGGGGWRCAGGGGGGRGGGGGGGRGVEGGGGGGGRRGGRSGPGHPVEHFQLPGARGFKECSQHRPVELTVAGRGPRRGFSIRASSLGVRSAQPLCRGGHPLSVAPGRCSSASIGAGVRSCSRWSPAARDYEGRRSRLPGRRLSPVERAEPSPRLGPR